MEQKTVFISYRRALSKHLARSIYMDLRSNGWDAFLDVNTIDSGDFDRIILNQIGARAHFVLLISPGSLERCANSGDWVLREIQEAVRLERNIVPIIEEGADFTLEMSYLPSDLRAIISKKNALPLPHFFFEAAVDMLRSRFLKTPEYITITAPPAAERVEVQRRMAAVEAEAPASAEPTASADAVRRIIGEPFEWCEVPAGEFLYGKDNQKLTLPAFAIAKYPVTYRQFQAFIDAGDGFKDQRWWQGLAENQSDKPGDQKWKIDDHPRERVSWYDAMAFCRWLSFKLGGGYDIARVSDWLVRLPTEFEWEKAARGTDGRAYPYGNEFDKTKSNTQESRIGKTTPVTQYPNGASLYGAFDMCGNVFDWCLTDYSNSVPDAVKENLRSSSSRVLRGGAFNYRRDDARAVSRYYSHPNFRRHNYGLRILRVSL